MISLSNWLVSGRANFAPYSIAPLGLSFKRPVQEVEYQVFTLRVTVTHIRFSLVVAMMIVASYGILDPFIYDKRELLVYALLVRFVVLFPSPLMLFLSTFGKQYPTYAQFVGRFAICVGGTGLFLMTIKSNISTLVYTFPPVVMVNIYSFFFVGLLFRYAFGAGVFVNVIYSYAIWTIDVPIAMGITIQISMITIFLLLAMAAYQKELISRQLFVSEAREREAHARQNQTDAQYLDWLRQLAKFLRHEVRHPIAQINSSIEIVQLSCKHDNLLAPYLASASSATQHVWNLVERASRATDAEAFVRQAQPQWTDLQCLLTEQVEACGRSNSGVNFQLQSPKSVVVHADPMLLKEAVGNLLSNAASFAHEKSTIKVVLEANTAQAAIKVINKGQVIEGDTESLFGPFVSTRASPSSEHQGLGLYLVRLIAQQSGGTASIANLDDDSGVEASIFLPLVPYGSSTQR